MPLVSHVVSTYCEGNKLQCEVVLECFVILNRNKCGNAGWHLGPPHDKYATLTQLKRQYQRGNVEACILETKAH